MYMLNLPKKVYFKKGAMNVALKELDEVYGFKKSIHSLRCKPVQTRYCQSCRRVGTRQRNPDGGVLYLLIRGSFLRKRTQRPP